MAIFKGDNYTVVCPSGNYATYNYQGLQTTYTGLLPKEYDFNQRTLYLYKDLHETSTTSVDLTGTEVSYNAFDFL